MVITKMKHCFHSLLIQWRVKRVKSDLIIPHDKNGVWFVLWTRHEFVLDHRVALLSADE